MTPINFTIKEGVTHFHYKPSELFDFVRRGKKHGDVGLILTKRDGNVLTYRGYGTIENPSNRIKTISFEHCEPFDGKMPNDYERLVPPKPILENRRFVFLDRTRK